MIERAVKFLAGMLFIAGLVAFTGIVGSNGMVCGCIGIICLALCAFLANRFEWENV